MLRYWVPHSHMYLLNLAKIWVLMLCPWVCQHLSSGLKCSYASQKPPKKFGAWGPNRCWDIVSPTPPCICLTWPRYGHWYSACGCATTSQVIWKCSYVSQKPPKHLVHETLIDAEILTSPLPCVFAQLDPVIRYQCFTCGCANTSQVV